MVVLVSALLLHEFFCRAKELRRIFTDPANGMKQKTRQRATAGVFSCHGTEFS